MTEWPTFAVAELQQDGVLLVEDGNHGEYRPRPAEFVEDGTRFIRATDLANGLVQFAQAGGISDVALNRIRKGIGRPGDILFSHKGTVGKLARVPMDAPPFVCSPQTTFWRVLDQSRLRRDYLYAFMRSRAFVDQWWVRKGETDMADYVSLTAQRQLRVTMPPLDVQRRIAEPLSALDDLIENNRRRVELLEQMAHAIYREWFVRFRYPGFEDVNFVDSTIGAVPPGWAVVTIGKISEAITRGIAPTYDDDGTWTVINQRCIRDGRVSLEVARRQTRQVPPAKQVRFGDVLINSTGVGTLGRAAIFLENHPSLTVDSHVTIVRPRNAGDQPWFGLHMLRRQPELEAMGLGSTGQTELGRQAIGQLPLAVPPPEIAGRFADLVWPLVLPIPRFLNQADKLSAIRDLLLSMLVTGQIDVPGLAVDAVVESVA